MRARFAKHQPISLTAFGVLGIGVGISQALSRDSRAGGPRPSAAPVTTKADVLPLPRPDGAALERLRGEVWSLRSELSALRVDIESAPEREAEPRPGENIGEEVPPAEPVASDADARQSFSDFYAASLAEQVVDVAWNGERQDEIQAYFNPDDFPGSQIESVECRATLCRVLIQHEDAKALALMSAASGRGPLRDGAASLTDRTHNTTELYWGRQGGTFEMPGSQ